MWDRLCSVAGGRRAECSVGAPVAAITGIELDLGGRATRRSADGAAAVAEWEKAVEREHGLGHPPLFHGSFEQVGRVEPARERSA